MLTGTPTSAARPETMPSAGSDSPSPGCARLQARQATNQVRIANTSQVLPAKPMA